MLPYQVGMLYHEDLDIAQCRRCGTPHDAFSANVGKYAAYK